MLTKDVRECEKMVDWDNIANFDRYPILSEELKEIGNTKTVKFLDDGKDVKAEILQESLKKRGIKARDSIVFVVEDGKDKKEVWLSATSYSNLKELKQVRDDNKGTLVNADVKVSRVSKGDMTEQAFKFEKA